jgi:hypothetical protein
MRPARRARTSAARSARAALLALTMLLAPAARIGAQDFADAAPPGPAASACAFIESGLPQAGAGPALDASYTSWFGLPGLETRAVACGGGWRLARVAAGFSQTGEPDLGWSAIGLACGVARPAGGAGLRAVARRERAIEPGSPAAARLEARAGAEVGWGAWLRAARGLRLWAAVPQSWSAGVAPPLDRPLEIGGEFECDGLTLWLTRVAPSGGPEADHGAGAALRSGPVVVWASVRDRPLRGGVGLVAWVRRLFVAAAVESHPELGETVRLALGLAGAAR